MKKGEEPKNGPEIVLSTQDKADVSIEKDKELRLMLIICFGPVGRKI